MTFSELPDEDTISVAREREPRIKEPRAPRTDGDGRRRRPRARHMTARQIPDLLDRLARGNPADQCAVLTAFCPCRNRVYNRQVWRDIFKTYEESTRALVRDQAQHAIQSLKERIATDPRTQDLIRDLAPESRTAARLAMDIPVWNPQQRILRNSDGNGLEIPARERPRRSRANRRR